MTTTTNSQTIYRVIGEPPEGLMMTWPTEIVIAPGGAAMAVYGDRGVERYDSVADLLRDHWMDEGDLRLWTPVPAPLAHITRTLSGLESRGYCAPGTLPGWFRSPEGTESAVFPLSDGEDLADVRFAGAVRRTAEGKGTRIAVRYVDTGMVLGDGADPCVAWADAKEQHARGRGCIHDWPDAVLDLEEIEYDSATHEVRLDGGIVQLLPRE
jgi:hypothetical protein